MDKTVVNPSSPNTKAAKSNENVNPAESNKQSENDTAADKNGFSVPPKKAAKSPTKAEGVSEGPRAPETALEMSATWTLDSTGVQQRMLAPSQALGTQAQPNLAPPQTYEHQSLSPKSLILVLRKANQNAVDVIRNLLQALKYGTGMMELETQAERAVALMEKGVGRLDQLEAYQIGASKMLHKVLAEIADKDRELAGANQELGMLQEDLQDRSHKLEGTEMKLARYVQQLKKSKMTAARLDGRLTFLMREFESQNAFSKQTPSAQKAPAATEPACEATEGAEFGEAKKREPTTSAGSPGVKAPAKESKDGGQC